MDTTDANDRIRERAYAIWQSEGCPDGCADKHWSAAEEEVLYADAAPDRNVTEAGLAPATKAGKRRQD